MMEDDVGLYFVVDGGCAGVQVFFFILYFSLFPLSVSLSFFFSLFSRPAGGSFQFSQNYAVEIIAES